MALDKVSIPVIISVYITLKKGNWNSMSTLTVRAGSVIGNEHILRQTNSQDKYRFAEVQADEKTYLVGVVCDGCSSGLHSEVGAALQAEFIVQETARILAEGYPMEHIPGELYNRTLAFLETLGNIILGETPAPAEV